MTNFTHDVAAFVLPVTASLAAVAAAYVAFTSRREAVVAVAPTHDADLMGTTVWFSGSALTTVKRNAGATSYDPQSRGSTG